MTVFVDTSALFAVLESDDAHHAAAGATWKELLERGARAPHYKLRIAGSRSIPKQNRLGLSIVDCVSFQAMREHGVHTAFCIDRHFREQGFETIP
jgi:predicted nucleic acid-binding protein